MAAEERSGAGGSAEERKDGGGGSSSESVLRAWLARIEKELFQSVAPFWTKHSFDAEHGGWFDCLARDGVVYDRTKHVWLQGRQVWMFCRLFNYTRGMDVKAVSGGKLDRAALLEQATSGVKFLRAHATADNGHVYFALAADGTPAQAQRKPFSACFLVMALSEWARAVADTDAAAAAAAVTEAQAVLDRVVEWAKTPALLGKAALPGAPALEAMAVPMMVLCITKDLVRDRPELAKGDAGVKYTAIVADAVASITKHIHADKKVVLENVTADGGMVDCIEGRQLNPGHAIECGWFMLEHALETGDGDLRDLAVQVIDWSFQRGWDKTAGGIWYFLDAGGHCPVQLEWNMKLWWPHCEALIAYALAYSTTRSQQHLDAFVQVATYTFDHFADPEHGEWYGYCSQQGNVTHTFKGGPYKGCFHVPRALLKCHAIFSRLLAADV